MKYLAYTTYCSGRSGLSNGVMSLEIGAILAFLMDRVLVINGNVSPPANVVQYPGIIRNRHPSTITDLFDLPVPWRNAEDVDLSGLDSKELTQERLSDCVWYFPSTLDLQKKDFQYFARGRNQFLTYSPAMQDAMVLTMPGGPEVGPQKYKMSNFGFYSYLFYFDTETKTAVHTMLRNFKPKQPYQALASRIAQELGAFNAAHVRRGDFKKTFGVTTLDRTPQEALKVLTHHFRPDDLFVIVTDERNDPFFRDIQAEYPQSLFLDQFILEHYRDDFLDLPQHDSLALAFLNQLIASEAQDFIGSMNSTFTSLIQRSRGNTGKFEPFKFLWNELPDKGMTSERGRHPKSTCVPMKDGIMVEEFQGPYSWNRVNPRINPAWMREWPESFLLTGQPTPHRKKVNAECPTQGSDAVADRDHPLLTSGGNGKLPQTGQDVLCLQGAALVKNNRAFVFLDVSGEMGSQVFASLETEGWIKLSDQVVHLDVVGGLVLPSQQQVNQDPVPCRGVIFLAYSPQSRTELKRYSSSQALCELLSHCVNFDKGREVSIRSLCGLIPRLELFTLSYASVQEGVTCLSQLQRGQNLVQVSTHHPEMTMMKRPHDSNGSANESPNSHVQIILTGGHQFTTHLPHDSQLLRDLYWAMGARGPDSSTKTPSFFQVPINDGKGVCSFSSAQLVCVVTESNELVQAKELMPESGNTEITFSKFIQIDNFLTPSELNQLLSFAMEHESDLTPGKVFSNKPDYRKSRVLNLIHHSELSNLIVDRVRRHLPDLLHEFDVPKYTVNEIEAQLTASNDGDFFKIHSDNGVGDVKTRALTYVYYFYKEPKSFTGGELVLYDTKIENSVCTKADSFHTIEPRNNSIVFFLSGCLHEVLPIRCPSKAFEDSRFTVNGWVRRQRMLPPTQIPESVLEWAKNLN